MFLTCHSGSLFSIQELTLSYIFTYVSTVRKHMCAPFVAEDSDVEVKLGQLDRMGGRTGALETLVVLVAAVAVGAVDHVGPTLRLHVDSVPARGKLDVDFKLLKIHQLFYYFLGWKSRCA